VGCSGAALAIGQGAVDALAAVATGRRAALGREGADGRAAALREERVGFLEIEEGCFELYFCKLLLGRIHTGHPEIGFIAA
jgi:hypothetical protein